MALVDAPRDMILRMFQLQAAEGFGDACQVFPSGLAAPQSPFGADDLVFGLFKERHLFSQGGLSIQGKGALAWSEIARSSVAYSGGKDVLVIEGRSGVRLRIDLSNPAGNRPAYRLQQLVDGLARRWSEAAYTGLAAMEVEAFFALATRRDDFAVNLFPMEPRPALAEAFLDLRERDDVTGVWILPSDPEDEGPVYAEAIAVVSNRSAADFAPFLEATRASAIAPIDENNRRKLGLAENATAWVVSWT